MPYPTMPNSPNPGGQGPFYSDPQWQDVLRQSDLTGQEQQIAQQQALAKSLREGGNQRMDVGSQFGRGMQGLASGVMNARAIQNMNQLAANRQKLFAPRGGNLPIAPPSPAGGGYDPSQFNDFTGGYGGGS